MACSLRQSPSQTRLRPAYRQAAAAVTSGRFRSYHSRSLARAIQLTEFDPCPPTDHVSMAIGFSPWAATGFLTVGHVFSPLVATNLPTHRDLSERVRPGA